MIRGFLVVPAWSFVIPAVACVVLAVVWTQPLGWILLPLVSAALVAAVLVGVHYAEVVAHRVGEPFGTLILAMAVTVIELGLIGAIMLSGGPAASTLARDTVFATVMIVLNGVVGLRLLMGAIRHHVLAFRVEGASHALSVLAPLTVLSLVLPTFRTTTTGPTYSSAQLAFAVCFRWCYTAYFCLYKQCAIGTTSSRLKPRPMESTLRHPQFRLR
jgi:Ca2+:H+ antiporter